MSIQYIHSFYPHILSSFMHVFTMLIRVLMHFSFIFAYRSNLEAKEHIETKRC